MCLSLLGTKVIWNHIETAGGIRSQSQIGLCGKAVSLRDPDVLLCLEWHPVFFIDLLSISDPLNSFPSDSSFFP